MAEYPDVDGSECQDDLKSLASRTYVRLSRATTEVQARIDADLADVGLTFSQFATLEVLHSKGPLCQRDIAQRILAHSSGNMTLVIDHLERRGLVERLPSLPDRRMIEVRLTPQGEELIGTFLPQHLDHIAEVMCVLTVEELQTLGELCRKLRRKEPGEPGDV